MFTFGRFAGSVEDVMFSCFPALDFCFLLARRFVLAKDK